MKIKSSGIHCHRINNCWECARGTRETVAEPQQSSVVLGGGQKPEENKQQFVDESAKRRMAVSVHPMVRTKGDQKKGKINGNSSSKTSSSSSSSSSADSSNSPSTSCSFPDSSASSTSGGAKPDRFRWFLSYRMMTASMLCLCFASVHMMNANLGMAMVCMVDDTNNNSNGKNYGNNKSNVMNNTNSSGEGNEANMAQTTATTSSAATTTTTTNSSTPLPASSASLNIFNERWWTETGQKASRVHWSAEDQGWIFAAFNAGLLCMLVTGFMADKFNAKYMIIVSVLLASFANIAIPLTATWNVAYAIGARFLVGLAEALLQPAINSLVTRWFPASERSYALGLATGGRQFGTLLIVPSAGALCAQSVFFGGWPSIFYVSAFTGLFFVLIYIVVGADKPSKQNCISTGELTFITVANTHEHMGQKRINRTVPWKKIFTSAPVWAALVSVVCHEFPLMTMIMFLPAYLHDVHHYESTKNGIFSALPTLALWISKITSSWLNTWLQRNTQWGVSYISKVLNGVGSVGLALFMLAATFLDSSRASLAVVLLCLSMFFTGLHTPGCQAALVAVAPAFSGAITGLTFFFVAISGMINPAMTKWIVRNGTAAEWNIVFMVSTVIALIPVLVFSWWGSANVQPWACGPSSSSVSSCPTLATIETVSAGIGSGSGIPKTIMATKRTMMMATTENDVGNNEQEKLEDKNDKEGNGGGRGEEDQRVLNDEPHFDDDQQNGKMYNRKY